MKRLAPPPAALDARPATRPELVPLSGSRPELSPDDHSATAAVFSSGVAVVLALAWYVLRAGSEAQNFWQIFACLGVGLFLLHFPAACRWLVPPGRRSSWYTTPAFLSLAGLAALTVLGDVSGRLGLPLGYPVAALGYALFAVRVVPWWRVGPTGRSLTLLPAAGLLAAYVGGCTWGYFKDPLYRSGLAVGWGHIDQLFHADICSLIGTYGFPSTGLDGLPYLAYHHGSHWIFARFCDLLGMNAPDWYHGGYLVVFPAFLLHSVLTFALDGPPSGGRSRGAFWFWVLLVIGFVGVLPFELQAPQLADLGSVFASESYCLAVAVSLLGLTAFGAYLRDQGRGETAGGWAAMIVFPLLLGLVGLLKISLMAIPLATACFAWLRSSRYRTPPLTLLLVVALGVCAISFQLANGPRPATSFALKPLGFLRDHVAPWAWVWHPVVYYFWTWAYVSLRLEAEPDHSPRKLWAAARAGRLLDLEIVLVAALAGAGPGLLGLAGSDAFYFSNYQHWVGLALVLRLLLRRGGAVPERPAPLLAPVAAGLLAVTLLLTAADTTAIWVYKAVERNLVSRGWQPSPAEARLPLRTRMAHDLYALYDLPDLGFFDRIGGITAATDARVREEGSILRVLRELAVLPREEKRRSVLYIPRSNTRYWELLNPAADVARRRKAAGFVAPALTGMALIDGMPAFDPTVDWSGYGFEGYGLDPVKRRQIRPEPTPADLRRRAAGFGFSQVIVIDGDKTGPYRITRLPCP